MRSPSRTDLGTIIHGQKSRTFEPAHHPADTRKREKMATGRRNRSREENYEDLHNLSSVVLYDTGSKTKGKLFEVERIIARRKCKFVSE